MVVCKYFLQGNCRFGANCRNEHPAGQGNAGGGGGGAFGGQNRFGALSNTDNRFGGNSNGSKQWTLNVADIKLDLTKGQGRPQWILSTYGAGRNTPESLFEGNEYSPEELRARFYEMAAKGQEAQADQEAIQLWSKAEQDMNNVANHIDDIQKFMEEAEQKHPNRYDFLRIDGTKSRDELIKSTESSNAASSSGFGATSPFGQSPNTQNNPFAKPAAATFGQPSAPSAFGSSPFAKPSQPSAFGQPSFGQSGFGSSSASSGQSPSAFGQPSGTSAFGQPAATSGFGKPAFGASGFGQSAFGQAAQPSTTPAFGQPAQNNTTTSPFGQQSSTPAFGTSAFGQPSKPSPFAAPAASSGFGGSATAFGQPAQASTAFGQSSQPTPAFGQPSQTSTGFGQPAFGQSSQPAFGKSTFGQSVQPANNSPFGQAPNTTSPFGSNTVGTGGFGQPQQSSLSPFGAKPAPTPNTNEVSMDADASTITQAQPNTAANPFGTPQTPATLTQAPAPVTAFAQPPAALPSNSTSETPHPLTSKPPKPLHYTQTLPLAPSQTDMSKRLTSYRGQRVAYLGEEPNQVPCYNRPDGRGPEKIWYPDAGAAQEVVALNREDKLADLQDDSDKYTDAIKQQYAYLFDEGRFKDGKIPLVPPMREWCLYDF